MESFVRGGAHISLARRKHEVLRNDRKVRAYLFLAQHVLVPTHLVCVAPFLHGCLLCTIFSLIPAQAPRRTGAQKQIWQRLLVVVSATPTVEVRRPVPAICCD